jgi:putative oxidoreductase
MVPHGYSKLMSFAERSEKFPDPLGVGHVTSMVLVVFAEFFCSIFLLMGLFTRMALIPLITAMAVAVLVIHSGDPFGDKEHALLFLLPYLGLFLTGPGSWSLDRLLKK